MEIEGVWLGWIRVYRSNPRLNNFAKGGLWVERWVIVRRVKRQIVSGKTLAGLGG